jgi:tetratricopeptide (TPR) repeat protein
MAVRALTLNAVSSVRALLVAAVMVVAATGGRAHAESAEAQVERLAAEAVNAYKVADYNRAVELLTRAYEIRQVPALLYNMAKAYDKLGDIDRACEVYRRYADSADADPRLKAKADARLVVLEDARRKKKAAERPVEPPKPQPPAPAVTTPPPQPAQIEPPKPAAPTAEEVKEQLKSDRQRSRRRDRYVALGLGVGAVALAGVAVGFSVSALQAQSDWSAQFGGDEAARRALKDTAITRAGIADGFYAGAVVAAGVGAYFLYRGFRPEPTAPSLALLPVASPTGAALVAAGTF